MTQSLEMQTTAEFEGARAQLKSFLTDKNAHDPAIIAQNKEIGRIILASLSQLSDDQRAVVVLRDIEGMSYDEIAQALGLELGTVKSRLSRARINLKEILETLI